MRKLIVASILIFLVQENILAQDDFENLNPSNTMNENFSESQTLKFSKNINNSFETTKSSGRALYLNGENINSIRNQILENVNLEIDSNGNIYIIAPHYEVNTDQSFHPLLPNELPKFKKEKSFASPNLPKGIYSKNSDSNSTEQNDINTNNKPNLLPKEIVPEINSESKIPEIFEKNINKIEEKK